MTGHRNVASLNEYRSLSLPQQKDISHAVTESISGNVPEGEVTDDELMSFCNAMLDNNETTFGNSTSGVQESVRVQEHAPILIQNCAFNGPVYFNVKQ